MSSTSMTDNDLPSICFRKRFSYSRLAPTFVCDNVSGLSEIARWALDLNLVVYREESHAPNFSTQATNRKTGNDGTGSNPVLVTTDALVYTAESIIQRLDQSNPPERRLFPTDPASLAEMLKWYRLFTGTFFENVMRYVYKELLPNRRDSLQLFTQRAPFVERLCYRFGFGSQRTGITERWRLDDQSEEGTLIGIQKVFQQIEELLSDGRRYLTGDTLTAADIAFASVGAMVTLPPEYDGAITRLNQIPFELRDEIIKLRATPAGQFILRVYQDDRPINLPWSVPREPGMIRRLLGGLKRFASKRQSSAFYFLQKYFPVFNVWCIPISAIARHDLVVEALERNEEFTIHEINARKMANQKGTFFLGMDRSNPQFDRERNFVLAASRPDDMPRVREFIRSHSAEITGNAQPFGRLDVANSLCYVVLTRLLGDYFGVPAPTKSTMQRWCLDLFYDLFFNFTNNKKIHKNAVAAGSERDAWTMNLIAQRKQDLKEGKPLEDNLLNRLIQIAQQPGYEWVSDSTICRNIGGLLTGAVGTTNKAAIYVLDQLFQRPEHLRGAVAAAQAFDVERVYGYVSEALRFSPVQPGVLRYNENEQYLKGSGIKQYKVKARRTVLALTASAMFDPVTFPDPQSFKPDRDARYMNWGFALHECYGRHINAISIPEFVTAVLRLKNVRRAQGREGRATGLNQGPFPNFFVVEFDSEATSQS
jgi:cytochrome P450/glutathione S-transferase